MGSWFEEETGTKEVEVEVEKGSFFKESGYYEAKIVTAGVYDSDNSPSKGVVLSVEFEDGTKHFEYVNFINGKGESTRTDDKGKKHKGYGLIQVESWDKAIDFGQPDAHTTKAPTWGGKDKDVRLFQKALGKKIGLCLRHVSDPNEEYPDSNVIEQVVDLATGKTGSELYFGEGDKRIVAKDKWLEKIAKNPTLTKKVKTKPMANLDAESTVSNW